VDERTDGQTDGHWDPL